MTEEQKNANDTPQAEEENKPVLDAEGLRGQLEYLAFTVLANVDRIRKGLITEGAAAQTDESMAANMAAVLYGKHPLVETKIPFTGALLLEQIAAHHPEFFPSTPVTAVMKEEEQVKAVKDVVLAYYKAVYKAVAEWKRESEEADLDKEAVAKLETKLKALAAEWTLVLTGAPRPRRAS